MPPTKIVVNIILACVLYHDAKQIGLKNGYVRGFENMTASEWMIVAIFRTLVSYPICMLCRSRPDIGYELSALTDPDVLAQRKGRADESTVTRDAALDIVSDIYRLGMRRARSERWWSA